MKNKKNQKGFALMEVMVAAGLLGVIAYLFMQMGEQVAHMEGRIKDLMDSNDLDYKVRVHMANPMACFKTFKPAFETLKTNEKLHFPIKLDGLVGQFDQPVLMDGKKYGRIKVSNIRVLFDEASIPKNEYKNELGIITIVYDITSHSKKPLRKTGRVSLSALVTKTYTTDKPFMTSCYSDRSILVQEVAMEVMAKTCESMGGNYNSETELCEMTSLFDRFQSTSSSSSFPQPEKELTSSNTGSSKTFKTKSPATTKKPQEITEQQKQMAEKLKNVDMKALQEKAMKMMQQFMKNQDGN